MRPGWGRTAALTLSAAMLLTGCSREVEIADPLDDAVIAEIARIKELARVGDSPMWPPAECDVVIYRITEDATYGDQHCREIDSDVGTAWAGPILVTGDEIVHVGDKPSQAPPINEAFPKDLADAYTDQRLPRASEG